MSVCSGKSPLGIYDMVGDNAIPQGADWDIYIKYKPDGTTMDLSAYTGRMQVRLGYNKPIILSLSTADGSILVGDGAADTPNVVLKFTPEMTSPVTTYSNMIYDLELVSPAGLVLKFVEGQFELRPEVTK